MEPSSTYCKICSVPVSGNLELHVMGKKHVRAVQMTTHQRLQAENTVFVRGFPAATTSNALSKHFSVFGNVTRINIKKEKNHMNYKNINNIQGIYAFVEFSSGNEAKAALEQTNQQLVSGANLTVRPKEVKVHPGPPTPRRVPDPPVAPAPTVDYDRVSEHLKSCESVEAQMNLLHDVLALTAADLEARKGIVDALEKTFTAHIPECQVHQFGSSVNGFGVRGCDMDLFLDLNLGSDPPPPPTLPNEGGVRIDDRGTKLIVGLQRATVIHRINYIFKALHRSQLPLAHLIKIPASRCPVIQFVYVLTGTQCDLSVNNRLALQNTRLLNVLCHIEPRLKMVIITLRHFFKAREIAGGASGTQKLSSYALYWLVITFLQQCDPPLLPAIDTLSSLAGEGEQTCTDGWNTTFSRDTNSWRTDLNMVVSNSQRGNETQPDVTDEEPSGTGRNMDVAAKGCGNTSIVKLLMGFFTFYSRMNLSTVVVCPRLGKVLAVDKFLAMNAAEPRQEEFKLNTVNIQDPFVLSHNIAQNINERLSERLAEELVEAAAKCASTQFLSTDRNKDWGINFLLSKECLVKPGPSRTRNPAWNSTNGFDYSINFDFHAANIPRKLFNQCHSMAEVKLIWVQSMCNLIKETLTEALLFTIEVTVDRVSTLQSNDIHEGNSEMNKRPSTDCDTDAPSEKKICPEIKSEIRIQSSHTQMVADSEKCSVQKTSSSNVREAEVIKEVKLEEMDCGIDVPTSSEVVNQDALCDEATKQTGEICLDTKESNICVNDKSHLNKDDSDVSTVVDTEIASVAACKETVLMEFNVQTLQPTWTGRKRVKKDMRKTGEDVTDTLMCEKIVAKVVQKELGNANRANSKPIMSFGTQIITTAMPHGKFTLTIQMKPIFAPKMFNCFYQFFKLFMVKLKNNSLFTYQQL